MSMDSVQQGELNHFLVETFNKILQYERAAFSARDTSDLSMKGLRIPEAVAQVQARQENTMSKIATRLGIGMGALTTVVGALIAEECLKRRGREQDHRVMWVILIPRGERAEWQHRLFHCGMVQMIGDPLSEERLYLLLESLKVLSRFSEEKKEGGMIA